MSQLTKFFWKILIKMNNEKCKASFWAGSAWGGDAAVSVQCFVSAAIPVFGDTTTALGTGTTSQHSSDQHGWSWHKVLHPQSAPGLGAAARLGQELLDANPVLLIFMCTVKPEELYLSDTWHDNIFDVIFPQSPHHHSSPILYQGTKKKKKGRKLAFWCWVSGYGIIQIQHLPLSYVVPKGQYLTLLLPITLCTCRGLWYYCKTL